MKSISTFFSVPASFLLAELAANQAGVGLNSDIIWDTKTINLGTDISLNIATGVITLGPGTYELTAVFRGLTFSNGTAGFLTIGWVDSSNVPINNSAAIIQPTTNTGLDSPQTEASTLITVTSSTDVKLRCTGATGTAIIVAATSRAIVKKLA